MEGLATGSGELFGSDGVGVVILLVGDFSIAFNPQVPLVGVFYHLLFRDADGFHVLSVVVAHGGRRIAEPGSHIVMAVQGAPYLVVAEYLYRHTAAIVVVRMRLDLKQGVIRVGHPVVPVFLNLFHGRETLSHHVDELHVAHILPGLDVFGENLFRRFVIGDEEGGGGTVYSDY